MKYTLKDLAADHPYYAADCNFYSNEPGAHWDTWDSFHAEYGTADIDMNLVIRWDIEKWDDAKHYHMQIIIIHQRKGIYAPHYISTIFEDDVPSIVAYLKKHRRTLRKIWKPL